MPMSSGLGALIRLGASVELDSDLLTIFIGCPETAGAAYRTNFVACSENRLGADYELETTGNHLLYRVAIVGAEVHVCASLLDSIGVLELLLQHSRFRGRLARGLRFHQQLGKIPGAKLGKAHRRGRPGYTRPQHMLDCGMSKQK